MPLEANEILHKWIKSYKHHAANIPTEPDKHDLLGFKGVEAAHHKMYIRKLQLGGVENDRVRYPRFLDGDVCKLAEHVNEVVNAVVKNPDKLGEDVWSGSFLEEEANHILDDKGFGRKIWSQCNEVEAQLKSKPQDMRLLWGVKTDSGYEKNDEDQIRLNLRYWMAARIHADINATCKERPRKLSGTTRHARQTLSQPVPWSCRLRSSRGGSPDLSQSGSALFQTERHRHLSATMESPNPEARRSKRSGTDDTDCSFSLGNLLSCDPKADPRTKSKQPKRLRQDSSTHGSDSVSLFDIDDIFTADTNLQSDPSSKTDMHYVGNCKKLRLQSDLICVLCEQDYDGILHRVIPLSKELYRESPHSLKKKLEKFNQALAYWESLIETLTASASVTPSIPQDPLRSLAAQETFDNRVAILHDHAPRLQIHFTNFEEWTVYLALFYDGLLGSTYMPFGFSDMVLRLRSANQSLYDSVAVALVVKGVR